MIYLVPASGDFEQLLSLLKKAEIPHLIGSEIGPVIKAYENEAVFVASLPEQSLTLVNRYPDLLFTKGEIPSVVMSVPGLVYDGSWVMKSTAMPSIDWMELENKGRKSGATARNADQLIERSNDPLGAAGEKTTGDDSWDNFDPEQV